LERGFEILGKTCEKAFGREELRRMLNRLRDYKAAYMLFIKLQYSGSVAIRTKVKG
jgi:hypothetical protein